MDYVCEVIQRDSKDITWDTETTA